ncbi:MAG: hypothetical protein KA715_12055 [Xanthomonadaceae bacterium]|nr:hypothetical protein [Xanthomonadaceae bacterium]
MKEGIIQKLFFVLIFLVFSTSSQAFDVAERYQCECLDTGLECNGQDYMTMIFDGDRLQTQQKDSDKDPTNKPLEAKLDKNYKH